MTHPQKFPIVGIGASAGGIPAIQGLLKGMPDAPGMAFVVVTHLSPERESLLHEVIGRFTSMPVKVAEDMAAVECDTVHVMPQNAVLTIQDGRLRLRQLSAPNRERRPIDLFLSALGQDQGEYAVAVILSGSNGDGTLGAKVIKERGGLVLAQASDDSGPRNPEMPQSAIMSGVVDVALPVEHMADQLLAFAEGFAVLEQLTQEQAEGEAAEYDQARAEIYGLLHAQSGHDFSGYKTRTFLRRVKRRMQIALQPSLAGYIDLLKQHPAEAALLFRDLLINVTNFFRDADAFALLEGTVIPRLFEGKSASDSVRIWVPGCATGEEVYSLAILLREHMETLPAPPRVQVFATDIDEAALAVARAARYPAPLLDSVSADRRQRFFVHDGDSYGLSSEIRELCIFSPHSVIRDPPFSHMDLVSCRNLLIYFGPDIQRRVIPIFHYALRPGGFLFLGTSEGIGSHAELFATLDKKHRIFQAQDHVAPRGRLPPLMTDGPRPRSVRRRPIRGRTEPARRCDRRSRPRCWSAMRRPMWW